MDETTMKVGLLMEAAQAQQRAIDASLQRLTQLMAGLDEVVREELRRAFAEEFRALGTASEVAAQALARVRQSASRRTALWAMAVTLASAAAPCFVSWAILPSRVEVARLRAERNSLTESVAELQRQAGRMDLRRCGDALRLCVRIDRTAPAYGASGDYLVVRGP